MIRKLFNRISIYRTAMRHKALTLALCCCFIGSSFERGCYRPYPNCDQQKHHLCPQT